MKHTQLFSKILLTSALLAQGAFAEKVKVEQSSPGKIRIARLTPGERKQILDDARAFDMKKKQSQNKICQKDDPKCEKEKTTERNLDSIQEKSVEQPLPYENHEL
jgi:hypothetical protein